MQTLVIPIINYEKNNYTDAKLDKKKEEKQVVKDDKIGNSY